MADLLDDFELHETRSRHVSKASLGQEWSRLLRYWLGDRRVLIAIALAVVGGGAVLNWGWLVAIGVAPILLAALPCAAMCALGLCSMKGKGGGACGKNERSDVAGEGDDSLPVRPAAKRKRVPESE
jgi:hypothetical protein